MKIVFEEIGVHVERDCSRAVTKHSLDDLDVSTGRDRKARRSMSEIMDSQILEAGLLHC